MTTIAIHDEDVSLERPTLVEGLPGVGLVGKLATDLLVEEFGMTYYASIDCDGLPRIAVYEDGSRDLHPPVRLYADESRNLVALQSDVPVSPSSASDFAECITDWVANHDATPIYTSGLAHEKQADELPSLYGVATGSAGDRLDAHDVGTPTDHGAVSGPTGALLYEARARDLDGIGLVVESDPQFPDPEAARVLVERGIAPLADVEVDTTDLVDRAEEIREQKEQLARRMQEAETDESSQARPLGMFQ